MYSNPENKYEKDLQNLFYTICHEENTDSKAKDVMKRPTTSHNTGVFSITIRGTKFTWGNKCFFLALQEGIGLSDEKTYELIKAAGWLNNLCFDTNVEGGHNFVMSLDKRFPGYQFEIYPGIPKDGYWYIMPKPQYKIGNGKPVRILNQGMYHFDQGMYHFELITNEDSWFVGDVSEGLKAAFKRDQQKEWQQWEDEKLAQQIQKQLEEEERKFLEEEERKLEKEKEMRQMRDEIVARELQRKMEEEEKIAKEMQKKLDKESTMHAFPGFLGERHEPFTQREKELKNYFFTPNQRKTIVTKILPRKTETDKLEDEKAQFEREKRKLADEKAQFEREKRKLEDEKAQFEREKKSFFYYQKAEVQKINEEKKKLEETLREALENLSQNHLPFRH